jgi:hypothetical protein
MHPERRAYFSSARPVVAVATCVAMTLPNLYLLYEQQFYSLKIHLIEQGTPSLGELVVSDIVYLAAVAAYAAPAVLALCLILPRGHEVLRTIVMDWPSNRAVIAVIALAPILLPAVCLPLAGIPARGSWANPAYFFIPLWLVSAPRLLVTLRATAAIFGLASAFAIIGVLISPFLMVLAFRYQPPNLAQPLEQLAQVATQMWRNRTGDPLSLVSGPAAWHISFYGSDHPSIFPNQSRFQSQDEIAADLSRHGLLIAFPVDREVLLPDVYGIEVLKDTERFYVTLPIKFLGMSRPPVSYVLVIRTPTTRAGH